MYVAYSHTRGLFYKGNSEWTPFLENAFRFLNREAIAEAFDEPADLVRDYDEDGLLANSFTINATLRLVVSRLDALDARMDALTRQINPPAPLLVLDENGTPR